MADNNKITELTELTSPASGDLFPIVDDPSGSPVTKKITIDNLDLNLMDNSSSGFASAHSDLSGIGSSDHHTKYALTDDLTSDEITQIQNIGDSTVSADQWGYLGALDQNLKSDQNVTFANITDNGLTASVPVVTDANKKLVSQTYANFLASLSGQAGSAFDFNSQNLTSVGTIGCGAITSTGALEIGGNFNINGNLIEDTNGNELLDFSATASAVNYFKMVNSATGDKVELQAQGDDTDIDLQLTPKGTGRIKLKASTIVEPGGSFPSFTIGDDGNTNTCRLLFGDSDSGIQGQVRYDHSDDSMAFRTDNTLALTLDSSQNATFAGVVDAAGGFKDNGTAGVDGTFTDNDGNTITVSGGIITNLGV